MRQRLLTVNMLAHLHRHDAGDCVRVIRSADRDCVDALVHLLKHLAKIVVFLGLGKFPGLVVQRAVVDVAEGDNVAEVGGLVCIAVSFSAHTDAGDVDRFIG